MASNAQCTTQYYTNVGVKKTFKYIKPKYLRESLRQFEIHMGLHFILMPMFRKQAASPLLMIFETFWKGYNVYSYNVYWAVKTTLREANRCDSFCEPFSLLIFYSSLNFAYPLNFSTQSKERFVCSRKHLVLVFINTDNI